MLTGVECRPWTVGWSQSVGVPISIDPALRSTHRFGTHYQSPCHERLGYAGTISSEYPVGFRSDQRRNHIVTGFTPTFGPAGPQYRNVASLRIPTIPLPTEKTRLSTLHWMTSGRIPVNPRSHGADQFSQTSPFTAIAQKPRPPIPKGRSNRIPIGSSGLAGPPQRTSRTMSATGSAHRPSRHSPEAASRTQDREPRSSARRPSPWRRPRRSGAE